MSSNCTARQNIVLQYSSIAHRNTKYFCSQNCPITILYLVLHHYSLTKQTIYSIYICLNGGDFVYDIDFSYIGKRIRDIRIEKRLTQEYIADYADVNVSHISNIENNKVKISLTLLINVCNALGVSIDFLLQNEYSNPSCGIETELMHVLKNMPLEKQKTLLRIAKAL